MNINDINQPISTAPNRKIIWVMGCYNETYFTLAYRLERGHDWREIGSGGQVLLGVTHWAPFT